MVEQLTLAKRPAARVDRADDALTEAVAEAVAYGKHFFQMTPWESRTPDQQYMLEQRISSFHNWRRKHGERLPEDAEVWEIPPPDANTLGRYIIKTSLCCPHHCYQVCAALRVYLRFHRRPELFVMVERVKV